MNRWCAEEATYRSTDGRTASALAVYQCGYGRCGEESTFAVNALRAVGIAARQVYAPWWSHCDDNHAWVEAFTGSRWQYLGACEPEPQLDRGWFTGAAARAMLIHTRSFAPGPWEEAKLLFPGADPLDTDQRGGVVYESVTQNYAPVVPVTVTVRDPQGRPLSGARVGLPPAQYGGAGRDRLPPHRPGRRRPAAAGQGQRVGHRPGGGALGRGPAPHRGVPGPGAHPGPACSPGGLAPLRFCRPARRGLLPRAPAPGPKTGAPGLPGPCRPAAGGKAGRRRSHSRALRPRGGWPPP